MRRGSLFFYCVFLLNVTVVSSALAADSPIDDAHSLLEAGRYPQALAAFQSLAAKGESRDVHLGIGFTLYRMGKFSEAEAEFNKVLEMSAAPTMRGEALYNFGNSQAQQEKYEEAIKSYESALKEYGDDRETRENLEFVKKILKKKEEEKNKQENKEEKQEKGGGGGGDGGEKGGGGQEKQDSGGGKSEEKDDQSGKSEQPQSGESEKEERAKSGESNDKREADKPDKGESKGGGNKPEEKQQGSGTKSKQENSGEQQNDKPEKGENQGTNEGGGGEAEGKEQGNASSGEQGSDEKAEGQSRTETLMNSVDEDRGVLLSYRRQKSREKLQERKESPSLKDW